MDLPTKNACGDLAYATNKTKLLVKFICKPGPKSLFWGPANVSTCHGWTVKKAIVQLANQASIQ